VAGLPKNLEDIELESYFSQFGPVEKAYVMKNFETGVTRGFGFVTYKYQVHFEQVIRCSTLNLKGCSLFVQRAVSRKEIKTLNTLVLIQNIENPHLLNNNISDNRGKSRFLNAPLSYRTKLERLDQSSDQDKPY
jgi:RNA recognition motif-containing protein